MTPVVSPGPVLLVYHCHIKFVSETTRAQQQAEEMRLRRKWERIVEEPEQDLWAWDLLALVPPAVYLSQLEQAQVQLWFGSTKATRNRPRLELSNQAELMKPKRFIGISLSCDEEY